MKPESATSSTMTGTIDLDWEIPRFRGEDGSLWKAISWKQSVPSFYVLRELEPGDRLAIFVVSDEDDTSGIFYWISKTDFFWYV